MGGALDTLNVLGNAMGGYTVPVEFAYCSDNPEETLIVNAFYSRVDRNITLCSGLALSIFRYMQTHPEYSEVASQATYAAMNFVVFHEVGHALLDITDSVLVGNEESAADAIAVVLAVESEQGLIPYLISEYAINNDIQGSYFDEHGSAVDRSGDVMCWTVGAFEFVPELYEDIAERFVEAGRDCVSEYQNQYAFVNQIFLDLDRIGQFQSGTAANEKRSASDSAFVSTLSLERLFPTRPDLIQPERLR